MWSALSDLTQAVERQHSEEKKSNERLAWERVLNQRVDGGDDAMSAEEASGMSETSDRGSVEEGKGETKREGEGGGEQEEDVREKFVDSETARSRESESRKDGD